MDKEFREEKKAAQRQIVERLFELWRIRLGHPRARLDAARERKIVARLNDGYTEEDLADAIEGCALSEWHRGANDRCAVYDDIELICRDAKHVDQFLAIAHRARARAAQIAHQEAMRAREEMERERRCRERLQGHGTWQRSRN